MKLTIRKANEQLIVALPEGIAARLGWGSGDVLKAEVVGDALKLVRVESDFDHTLRIAGEAMDEYSRTPEQLAKT